MRSLTVVLQMRRMLRLWLILLLTLGLRLLLRLLLVPMMHDGSLSSDLAGRELASARGAQCG